MFFFNSLPFASFPKNNNIRPTFSWPIKPDRKPSMSFFTLLKQNGFKVCEIPHNEYHESYQGFVRLYQLVFTNN